MDEKGFLLVHLPIAILLMLLGKQNDLAANELFQELKENRGSSSSVPMCMLTIPLCPEWLERSLERLTTSATIRFHKDDLGKLLNHQDRGMKVLFLAMDLAIRLALPVGGREKGMWVRCNWSQQRITELKPFARFRIPPFAHYWKDVTDDQRKSLHKLVLEKFDMDIHLPHVETHVNNYIRDRFRDHRCALHKYYVSIPNNVNKRQHPFDGVSQESWERWCDLWETDKFKLRARAEEAESQLEELRGWKEAAQETQETHRAQIQQQQRQLDYLMEKLGGPPSMWYDL
ncbi:hypothetical protein IFM89_021548 [Coptis chinensis]|uniref:Uncharacterized protein n=1 Tax=Coptis chinensis TaxID=261450 RepID=A0A835M5W3_9MAGN|nr:hypothetical protein IFM89_021548 [Coptis chinensis]